jgi:hypothetical protein
LQFREQCTARRRVDPADLYDLVDLVRDAVEMLKIGHVHISGRPERKALKAKSFFDSCSVIEHLLGDITKIVHHEYPVCDNKHTADAWQPLCADFKSTETLPGQYIWCAVATGKSSETIAAKAAHPPCRDILAERHDACWGRKQQRLQGVPILVEANDRGGQRKRKVGGEEITRSAGFCHIDLEIPDFP